MGISGTLSAFSLECVAHRTEWACALLNLPGAPGWRGHRPQRKVTAAVLLMNKDVPVSLLSGSLYPQINAAVSVAVPKQQQQKLKLLWAVGGSRCRLITGPSTQP